MIITIVLLALVFLALPIGMAAVGFWLWMLVDAIRNDAMDGTSRILWVLLVWFLPIIGSVVYFFLGRNASGRVLA